MNLSPELQSDLVAGLRGVLPCCCAWCSDGLPVKFSARIGAWMHHWTTPNRERHHARCHAQAERALLARVDAEVNRAQ